VTIRFVEEAQREFLDAISYYERLARALVGDLSRRCIEVYCGWPIIRKCTACDRAHIAASTFECFPITFLTSSEDKFSGFSLSLMAAGNRSIGFLGATKSPNGFALPPQSPSVRIS
jgi:hypothetical protein